MSQDQAHKLIHIFISHIQEEEAVAIKLKEYLRDDFLGWTIPFVSSEDLAPGTDWLKGILESLQKEDILLLMCSPESINEPWLYFEAGATFVQDKPVIPICYGGLEISELPPQFGRKQAITLRDPEHIKSLYKVVAAKLPPPFRIPQVDYQARSLELVALVPDQKILFFTSPTLIDSYRLNLKGKILPHLIPEFTDYSEIDSKLAGGAYKNEYKKIVYHHPHPDSSDPCYVQLIERLKNDHVSLPLITFSDGNCADFKTGRTYDDTVFVNMLTTLIQRINDMDK